MSLNNNKHCICSGPEVCVSVCVRARQRERKRRERERDTPSWCEVSGQHMGQAERTKGPSVKTGHAERPVMFMVCLCVCVCHLVDKHRSG